MLFLLDKDVRTVKWNGIPLHEASSAIVKEEINGDFTLSVRYPITDSGIYRLIKSDMLIKAPVPILGAQLFRIKKPIEHDDYVEINAYHITEDIMQRSVEPMSLVQTDCGMALSQMVQNAKADIEEFSFSSDIVEKHTFNTKKVETIYSILMDGKHSILGTWEGELIRDNFSLKIKKNRGEDRGVVITTHKNLKSYQRTKSSQGIVTRIYATSTFKEEGAEEETVLSVTVDSPLIGEYPYINEREYQNNDLKTLEELIKWAKAKFEREGLDKPTDAIEIEAYELDGQIVHLGDTVNLKSWKHNVDVYKKAVAYEYDCLLNDGKGGYLSITFDDKAGVGVGGSGHSSSGVSNAADTILDITKTAQDIALERALANADRTFDAEFNKRKAEIEDGIEKAKAHGEEYADKIRQDVEAQLEAFDREFDEKQAEIDKRVDKELEAFKKEAENFEFTDEVIDKIADKVDLGKEFDELEAQIRATNETSRLNAEMFGNDGITRYNKNLVMDGTERTIPFDGEAAVIKANDGGFKAGVTYTISFESLCELLQQLPVSFEQTHQKPWSIVLEPTNPRFSTETTTDTTVKVYPDDYTITITSDWYETKTIETRLSEANSLIRPEMVYRSVADGNQDETMLGEWAERPDIIFDGGGS